MFSSVFEIKVSLSMRKLSKEKIKNKAFRKLGVKETLIARKNLNTHIALGSSADLEFMESTGS